MNFFESFSCSSHDWWKAAIPAIIEKIIMVRDMMDQITPQQWDEPPYFLAKTVASELFSFRRIRSSHCRRIRDMNEC